MFRVVAIVSVLWLLQACEVTQPEPYQADRAPEERTEYNGLEGVVQQQKDQGYLMDKALTDKCNAAKIDLAVAQSNGDTARAKQSQTIIGQACVK